MKEFSNKAIIVTGAGSGIGKATALSFARSGGKVVVSDIDSNKGMETLREIESIGGEGLFIACDVAIESQVKNLVDQTMSSFGRLDCAFNNAGVEGASKLINEYSMENWDQVMNINLKGPWLCMKYEIPAMLKSGGGSIVNCSSIAGLVGFLELGAYVASKHGLIGLSKVAALEFGKNGIKVNSICPGAIDTPMLHRVSQDTIQMLKEQNPMGRIGYPQEIADSVLWLCSERASYVNGHSLVVDGGQTTQ